MNIKEYNKVSNLDYEEYCIYLQNKYGLGKYNYMFRSWTKNQNASRTKEGLVAHHKYEDSAILLSTPEFAKNNPYEWQEAKNLVYCDYLEHLYLHILICEKEDNPGFFGSGGIYGFIVPELNDVYSGWIPNVQYKKNCFNLIINDLDTYLVLLKRYYRDRGKDIELFNKYLFRSFNERFGLWSNENNKELYEKIKEYLMG